LGKIIIFSGPYTPENCRGREMKIVIGCDHGGFELKTILLNHLQEKGVDVLDQGSYDTDPVDYPDIAFKVCETLAGEEADLGILICGTGIGMSNAAGKVNGIIPALCTDTFMAKMSRLHNDANVLCLGGRVIGSELAKEIVDTWVSNEPLMDEKYVRRRKKITDYDKSRS
jgi:ribose 5-phosphate isomerase B